jgi:hypothetical protein
MDLQLVARFVVGASAVSLLAVGLGVLAWEARRSAGRPVRRDTGPLALVNFVGIVGFVGAGLVTAVTMLGVLGPLPEPLDAVARLVGIVAANPRTSPAVDTAAPTWSGSPARTGRSTASTSSSRSRSESENCSEKLARMQMASEPAATMNSAARRWLARSSPPSSWNAVGAIGRTPDSLITWQSLRLKDGARTTDSCAGTDGPPPVQNSERVGGLVRPDDVGPWST